MASEAENCSLPNMAKLRMACLLSRQNLGRPATLFFSVVDQPQDHQPNSLPRWSKIGEIGEMRNPCTSLTIKSIEACVKGSFPPLVPHPRTMIGYRLQSAFRCGLPSGSEAEECRCFFPSHGLELSEVLTGSVCGGYRLVSFIILYGGTLIISLLSTSMQTSGQSGLDCEDRHAHAIFAVGSFDNSQRAREF